MNKLLVGSLVVAMLAGLPACDQGTQPQAKPADPSTPAKSEPASEAKPADTAPKPEAKPADAKPAPAAAPTQDTADGAAKMFVAAMAAGDFMRASDLCDPGAEGRDEILEAAKIIVEAEAKQNPELNKVVKVILDSMTKPWQGAEVTTGPEQGRNASTTFKLSNGVTRDVVMQKTDGKWFAFPTRGIVTVTKTEVPAEPKPATPAPAPTPAPDQPPSK